MSVWDNYQSRMSARGYNKRDVFLKKRDISTLKFKIVFRITK